MRVCRWDRESGQAWVVPLQTSAARRVEKRTLRQIRCAVYYKSSDREFEFRVVECEESEDEVIPLENSRSVALQCVGHSLKEANTGCSRASAPVIKEDGGRCLASLGPDLSEVFLEVVTDVQ